MNTGFIYLFLVGDLVFIYFGFRLVVRGFKILDRMRLDQQEDPDKCPFSTTRACSKSDWRNTASSSSLALTEERERR
jgi:hypothetical protein